MAPLTKEEAYGLFTDVDGTSVRLGARECDAVRAALRLVEGGRSQVGSDVGDPFVSTGAVADILGVSRRTVTRILDAGEIPYERHGNGNRRVRMSDALRYKQESDRRKEALSQMRGYAHEYGLDDLDMIEGYLARFPKEA